MMRQSKRKKLIICAIVALLCLSGVGCINIKTYIEKGQSEIPSATGVPWSKTPETTKEPEYASAEEYYSAHGQIVNQTDVQSSQTVRTEAEAVALFTERGFTQHAAEADLSLEGEYLDDGEISDTSKTKHPIYTTYYYSKAKVFWTITDVNGQIYAYPASYNLESGAVPVIYSETASITSYVEDGNRFFETVPNDSTLVVKTISRIDADALDALTEEEIGK